MTETPLIGKMSHERDAAVNLALLFTGMLAGGAFNFASLVTFGAPTHWFVATTGLVLAAPLVLLGVWLTRSLRASVAYFLLGTAAAIAIFWFWLWSTTTGLILAGPLMLLAAWLAIRAQAAMAWFLFGTTAAVAGFGLWAASGWW